MSQNATLATQLALCHHFAQPCQCDVRQTRNTTCLKCCACHEKWKWTRPKCCTCDEKFKACSENVAKVLRLPRHFRHITKHVHMSRSATPATRNEATWRVKRRKMTTPMKLPIGTAILFAKRQAAADGWATPSEQTSTPRPPEWNGNPCYTFGKNNPKANLHLERMR